MSEKDLNKEFEKMVVKFFFISALILLIRVMTTFLLAFRFSQDYSIEFVKGVLPIIVFSSERIVFTKINTYSIFFTSAIVFFIFSIIYFAERSKMGRCKNAILWLLGLFVTVLQYLVALFLNKYTQFSTSRELELPLTVLLSAGLFLMTLCIIKSLSIKNKNN